MFNLFDILQSQSGGLQGFGHQFGLSQDQTRKAMEALLPALTIGLQRNAAADPTGFGRLFGLVGMEGTGASAPPTQADQLLGQLFGSPLVAQAVLQQASAASGVGAQALRQMLPVMAGMIVAGIVHLMLNQPQTSPAGSPVPAGPRPFAPAAFWTEWIGTVLNPAAAPPATPPRQADAPTRGATKRQTGSGSSAAATDTPVAAWQQLFQTGAEVQEQNVRAMQEIFDTFWNSNGPAADMAAPSPPEGPSRRGRS